MIGLADITAARNRLAGVASQTPVFESRTLNEACRGSIYLKMECFQRTGSFKFRGAYNRLAGMTQRERDRGVVAESSGNHGQALALAASMFGTRAVVLMPTDAPASKVDATLGYGAEVVRFDRSLVDEEVLLTSFADEHSLSVVHSFDDWQVMAGQGTIACELLEEVGNLDVVVACIGGGGLISGCVVASKALSHRTRVIGVEPLGADDTRRSMAAGHRVSIETPQTIADGLQLKTPGELTFQVIQRLVEDVVTVSDDEIASATAILFERLKVVAEPSGAVALAAVLSGKLRVEGLRVGVVVTGGNIGVRGFLDLFGDRRRRPEAGTLLDQVATTSTAR